MAARSSRWPSAGTLCCVPKEWGGRRPSVAQLHSAVTGVAAAPVPTRLVRPDGAEVGFGLAASCDARVVMCAATVEV